MIVPLVSWPITTLSVIVVILSILLSATVLLHKSRGGGMSDLFGGGMSTSMGGVSTAERRLDRITVVLALIWLLTIIGLLVLYRIGA
ncbi:preprotein translocase subunit SecG [Tessaracoccus massiliensis]|uniref:preprotein translocase subunit SecG n=1 Tax=Tessaracoccus massiliensis TaxID=1522311 RepID=UPI001FE8935D|nr:preprotein translocase subunit SecG [Tessaracoccus massiliensis]